MRIVSWNMNQQTRGAWAFLLEMLDPDVALLQEAVVPRDLPDRYDLKWTPAWPNGQWGSGILSRLYHIEEQWDDAHRGAVVMARCSIPPLGTVSIASVHARVNRTTRRVIPDLRETFDEVRPQLGKRFILGGDLNTAREAARRWPKNGHREFWADLEGWGFRDCHYELNGVERQSFWRGRLRNVPATPNGLQDDHVFVDADTLQYVRQCFVWDTTEVRTLSDHGPVVVELALPDGE